MTNKIICFSLWGNNPKYTVGAVRNVELAKTIYPDWKCRFYVGNDVPVDIIDQLKALNAEIEFMNDTGWNGMMWRFLGADSDDIYICRDTDSRLNYREKAAVDEWLNSDKDFHIMRDHPYHNTPILGGMWGVVGGKLKGIVEAAKVFSPTSSKGQDQQFLTQWVWSKISNGHLTVTTHDPIFVHKPFPDGAKRGEENGGVWFVGQVFDENDKYNSQTDVDMVRSIS